VAELYEHFETDTNHLRCLTKLKQSGIMEDFIAYFERKIFGQRACLMPFSHVETFPMSSWLGLRVGWRILKEIKKNNRLFLLKNENPPLFLALN
jgi:hypothetical protein